MNKSTTLIFADRNIRMEASEEKVIQALKGMNIQEFDPASVSKDTVLSWTVVQGGLFIEVPLSSNLKIVQDMIVTALHEQLRGDCDCGGYLDRECSPQRLDEEMEFGEFGLYSYEEDTVSYNFNNLPTYLEFYLSLPGWEELSLEQQFRLIDHLNSMIAARLPEGFDMENGCVIIECDPSLPIFSRDEVETILDAAIIMVLKMDRGEGYLRLLTDVLNED